MLINNKEEAIEAIAAYYRRAGAEINDLKQIVIKSEDQVLGHKIWAYHVTDIPVARDGGQNWFLDTSVFLSTTFGQKTPEQLVQEELDKTKAAS